MVVVEGYDVGFSTSTAMAVMGTREGRGGI